MQRLGKSFFFVLLQISSRPYFLVKPFSTFLHTMNATFNVLCPSKSGNLLRQWTITSEMFRLPQSLSPCLPGSPDESRRVG